MERPRATLVTASTILAPLPSEGGFVVPSMSRAGFRSPPPHRYSRGSAIKPPIDKSRYTPHQGAREVERRRKRLAARGED